MTTDKDGYNTTWKTEAPNVLDRDLLTSLIELYPIDTDIDEIVKEVEYKQTKK